MSVAWELELVGGERQSFADWGLTDLHRTRTSQDLDTVSFTSAAIAYDADPIFAYGATVKIFRDGLPWFAGIIISTPRSGRATAEAITWRAAGPWWYLTKLTFQQSWTVLTAHGPPAVTAAQLTPHIMLNIADNGSKLTVAQQITAILNFAIAAGAQFQIGTIGIALDVPAREIRNLTCAQAIKEQLRYAPDAVCWFDYATTPPTFNITRASALTPISLASSDAPVEAIDIRSRDDLSVPSVVIHYSKTDEVDGTAYNSFVTDSYPPTATGQEFGALVSEIQLKGAKITNTTCTVLVETATSLLWYAVYGGTLFSSQLRRRLPWLDGRYINISVADDGNGITPRWFDPTTDPPTELAAASPGNPIFPSNIIVEGSVPDWFPKVAKLIRIKALIFYDKFDNPIPLPDQPRQPVPDTIGSARLTDNAYLQPVTVDVLATDAPVGWQTYSRRSTVDPAEATPVGLAQYLYEALHGVTFEGSLTLLEDEVTDAAPIGRSLNLTGARAEWATMQTPIQSIEEDVDTGRTVIRFGPPQHLGLQDLIEWLRALRPIQRWSAISERSSALTVSDGQVPLAKYNGDDNAGMGLGHTQRRVYLNGLNPNYIDIDSGSGVRIAVPGTESIPKPEVSSALHHLGLAVYADPTFAPAPGFVPTKCAEVRRAGDFGEVNLNDKAKSKTVKLNPDGLQIDAAAGAIHALVADLAGRTAQFREVAICDNGTTRHALVLMSEIY